MSKSKKSHFATRVIHAGQHPDSKTGAVMPTIYTTSIYAQKKLGVEQEYVYSRCGNPTRESYEKCVAELEDGSHGFAFASGIAAISSVLELLEAGSHIIVVDNVYGGSHRLFETIRKKSAGLSFSYVDMTDPSNIESAITSKTKMIWAESPTNPLLKIVDLAKVAKIARKHKLISVIDNTFATPWIQKPLKFGFDIVVHSATKYLNGHSDVVNGIIVVGDNDELAEQINYIQKFVGAIPSPFDCYSVLRGIKTLDVRMQRHCENALELAQWLEKHKKIAKVYYPGLISNPQYKLAKKQMSAFGGVVTIELKGNFATTKKFLESLNLFVLTGSLGGVESTIAHPATMSHSSLSKAERTKLGITDNLLRISVGIENITDIKADLAQAL